MGQHKHGSSSSSQNPNWIPPRIQNGFRPESKLDARSHHHHHHHHHHHNHHHQHRHLPDHLDDPAAGVVGGVPTSSSHSPQRWPTISSDQNSLHCSPTMHSGHCAEPGPSAFSLSVHQNRQTVLKDKYSKSSNTKVFAPSLCS